MSDYISKQAAIDAIRGWVKKAFEDWGNAETEIRCFNAIYPLIMALPSAQPEIIRCKDCKYWTHIKRTKRYWCEADNGIYDFNLSPNDFCSRAERREE